MKRRTRQTTKKILMIALSALTIVNVFCIGFSSFLYKGPSSALSGNINVTSGGMIEPIINSNNPINAPIVLETGFKKDGKTSFVSSLDLKLDIKIDIPRNVLTPSIKFSIKQNDDVNAPEYAAFNMMDYITGATLTNTVNGAAQTSVTKVGGDGSAAKSKIFEFSLSDKCFPTNFTKYTANSVLSFNFEYKGSDFASDIFAPCYFSNPTFDMEIKG